MESHYADYITGRSDSLPWQCVQGSVEGTSTHAVESEEIEPSQWTTSKDRTTNFNASEDYLLASAWLNVSQDPIIGIDQSKDSYWKRILQFYNTHKTFRSERTKKSLLQRWGVINCEVSKMSRCYDRIKNRNESGKPDKDMFIDAFALYKAEEKRDFQMIPVWELLHSQSKWVNYASSQGKKQKSSATSTPGSSSAPIGSNDVDVEDSVQELPVGRKRAKAHTRSAAESRAASSRYIDLISELRGDVQNDMAQRASLFNLFLQNEEQNMVLKREELAIRLRKEERQQRKEEERIMALDLSSLSEPQRQYYTLLQGEILANLLNQTRPSQGL